MKHLALRTGEFLLGITWSVCQVVWWILNQNVWYLLFGNSSDKTLRS